MQRVDEIAIHFLYLILMKPNRNLSPSARPNYVTIRDEQLHNSCGDMSYLHALEKSLDMERYGAADVQIRCTIFCKA